MPYQELGNLLQSWRSTKFRSALAIFKEAKLPFSYSVYTDFERGATLPSVDELLAVAKYFSADPDDALLLWAQVQMPNEKYRALFRKDRRRIQRNAKDLTPDKSSLDRNTTPPTFENTWVFGPADHDLLLKAPWLFDIWRILSMAYPSEVKWNDLPIPDRAVFDAWALSGHIITTQNGARLKSPHFHVPKTAEWDDVRINNIKRTLDILTREVTPELLRSGHAYRELVHRTLTREQAKKWVERLQTFETELKDDAYDGSSSINEMYALVAMLGPRKLKPS